MTKLNDVNTTDIYDGIRLGCQTMCNVFEPERNIPRFGAIVRPEVRLGKGYEAHVSGRHLNALLNAEDAIGIKIDEKCIQKHSNAAFLSYGGSIALPLQRPKAKHIQNPESESSKPTQHVDVIGFGNENPDIETLRTHNIREGFHALYSLVKFRNSSKAQRFAESSITAIFDYWNPNSDWDYDRLARDHGLKFDLDKTFIVGIARSIGPLVKYYEATGYGKALELAIILKEKTINEFFIGDGSYDVDKFGDHVHSTTCVMSSLAQLADLTSDSTLINRVKTFYDNGLWELRDELGWSYEGKSPEDFPDSGESNNTGDILETALILGKWGFTEYYHDAERILRCHLLPSQLRDISFIEDSCKSDDDSTRDVGNRLKGAFGFPAPYGHEPVGPTNGVRFNLDIVGGAVGSLCEAFRQVTQYAESGHKVNLLFDHETSHIKVESPYTNSCLKITLKRQGPLFVRIPPWTNQHEMKITGHLETPTVTNGYLFFSNPPINNPISFDFTLPENEVVLKHQTHDIRAKLRGDEVIAMDSFGADLTFFDPIQ